MLERYTGDSTVRSGKLLGTNRAIQQVRDAFTLGQLRVTRIVMTESERVDIIAHRYYGDARLWWIIAAVSGIGWWLQVPAGTQLTIPVDLNEIQSVLS
jgi:hypothetical protein